jgi:flagellar protein FliO/FliZ
VRLTRLTIMASSPSRARLPAAGCALIALVAAAGGGDVAGGALRASAVVALLAAAAVAIRAAPPGAARAATLVIEERHPLARDAGVAVVAAGTRRLVVGYGTAGVRLLADVGAPGARETP